jgi:hypothetical protein
MTVSKQLSEQVIRFVETARVLGCDEDKEHFEAKLGKIAIHKPIREQPKKPAKKTKSR